MVDHPRLALVIFICFMAGATLLLSRVRWFARMPLNQRLAPYGSDARKTVGRPQRLNDFVIPLVLVIGSRLTKLFGLEEEIAQRLLRARSQMDVAAFRLRQFAWALASMLVGLLFGLAFRPAAVISALLVIGLPMLAFLLLEQQLISLAAARQKRQFAELPVVAEQLAMLIGAGYSLGSALGHLAARGSGVISEDLTLVCARMQQGLTAEEALREWSGLARLPEIDRLVSVLSLSSDTNDLGRLIAEEARSVRGESQRRLAELIDRRTEQVWIPVTVATLVPGLIFLAIPFLQALRLFSHS